MSSPSRPLSKLFSGLPTPFGRDPDTPSLYCQLEPQVFNYDDSERRPSPFPPFLPLSAINDVITPDLLKPGSSWIPSIFKSTPPYQIAERAKKVYAILGLCEKQFVIWDLLREGLTDEDLPLSKFRQEGHPATPNILVSDNGKKFESFSKLGENIAVENFLHKQWWALAPVFPTPGQHISLDDRRIPLPFFNIERLSTQSRNTVYKGMLHASHRMPQVKDHVQIAIKCYRDLDEFKRENENLEKIRDLQHPHLIQHIATIQQGDVFYGIFPWANGGNLSDFWEQYPDALQTRHHPLFMWCFQQMLGLVDCLVVLHDINCRHGDLKPDNILHFEAPGGATAEHDQYGTLVITDVGVSRVHHEATEKRSKPTTTGATTRCYEAPEAEINNTAPRSRKYDMWSVGCVFMEFVIWLLYGYRAIGQFRRSRMQDEYPFSQRGAYYKGTAKDTADIHPVVSRAFNTLRNDPRCGEGTGLRDLVNLIANDLIVIEPQRRLNAEELKEKFKDIIRKAEDDKDYLLKSTKAPPDIPSIFSPSRRGDGYG